jgi:hypothetical protein
MKIIKKAKGEATKFLVERSFYWGGRNVAIGEEVQVENPTEAMGLINCKKIKPILPPVAVYIALVSFQLPGRDKKHDAKKNELVELRAEDALPLLLNNIVLPQSSSVWRPLDRKLKK